ncbi:DUF1643 domain-containing protein [Inhella sp.]|uniref:DUF1643 domain-containing protein n=1 Tax=Inhella sp. TaxID=1921806 RepID=UPI0035B1A323
MRGRVASNDSMQRGADISRCGRYRYALWRTWSSTGGVVMFVGLNPSTADATQDDPTLRRCMAFARSWGFGGLVMTNLFAWRATDPRELLAAHDPVGPRNDAALRLHHARSSCTVAAWGAQGTHQGRHQVVRAMLPHLHCLRLTKDGHPAHPLYLPASLRPVVWSV